MIPRVIPGPPYRFRGEAYYLPEALRVWIPIRKNAHTAIHEAIRDSRQPWVPLHSTGFTVPAQRVAFWRNPYSRMEAAAYTLKIAPHYFNDWIVQVCYRQDELRDPHIMSQWLSVNLVYPVEMTTIIRWDFAALAKVLRLDEIKHINPSPQVPYAWDPSARATFTRAYARDFEIWNRR